ncbi:hypothetical protein FJZ27_00425 [Candidatus Peribacteria bacterium]|nr:hypothetical protein [Candidatus Peribacteria bacterium]
MSIADQPNINSAPPPPTEEVFDPKCFQARSVIEGAVRNASHGILAHAHQQIVDGVVEAYGREKAKFTTLAEVNDFIAHAVRDRIDQVPESHRLPEYRDAA